MFAFYKKQISSRERSLIFVNIDCNLGFYALIFVHFLPKHSG